MKSRFDVALTVLDADTLHAWIVRFPSPRSYLDICDIRKAVMAIKAPEHVSAALFMQLETAFACLSSSWS